MKRRLFLKTGSVGIGGIIAMPTVIYGCATLKPLPQGPSMSVSLFQDGSRLFDSSIAELRLSGSGELASAEAEDPDLSGIAEQVALGTAAVPAELDSQFAESSTDMLNAANSIAESAPELLPLGKGLQAEIADDFALLKVVKASTLLASAAMATPQPLRKISAAEKMISSAEVVHKAIHASSESELIESTEELLAYSEEYVGAAEQYSAEVGFIDGADTFESAIHQLAENRLTDGVKNLLTATDNIALSSEYYVHGVNNLNAKAEHFGSDLITSAKEFIPYAKKLVASSTLFHKVATGESAELGAAEMIQGAEALLAESSSEVENLGIGGKTLDIGGDRFIGGEITYNGAENYSAESNIYLKAAENFNNRSSAEAEAEFIQDTAELLYPASEIFYYGAEALNNITFTEGVESLIPAAEHILAGSELLQSEAENAEALFGAENMVEGAAEALFGASESAENPSKLLEKGAGNIETGTLNLMNGAAEFVQGYK